MIQFEYDKEQNLIVLHNSSEIPLKDKVKMTQRVTQSFNEEGARVIYKNIKNDLEQSKKMIENSEKAIKAEEEKLLANKKNNKHLKKVLKQLKDIAINAKFDLEPKEEVENESKSD